MKNQHFNIPLEKWINIAQIALVIIDMQKGLKSNSYMPLECQRVEGLGKESVRYMKKRINSVILNIKKILNFFRSNDLLVIFTRIGHQYKDFKDAPLIHKERFNSLADESGKFYLMEGYRQYEILNEIAPLQNELVLNKATSGTFAGTQLNLILRNNNIDKLLICGALTSCCVESTAREAFDLGFLPTVLEDACIAADRSFHESSLRVLRIYYANVMRTGEIIEFLKNNKIF